MAEPLLVMLAQRIVVSQQLIAAQHQLAKIHHPFTLTLVFIELVNLYFLPCFCVTHRHVFGALRFLFASRDEPLQLFRRETLVVDVVLFDQALHSRQLVLGVQYLK